MSIKTIALIVFLVIIASLANALFNLVRTRDPEHSLKTARALTWRISLSLLLVLGLILAYAGGVFQPHGLGARIEQVRAQQHTTAAE